MRQNETRQYTLRTNRSKKTYTIRVYENGKLIAKYRTYSEGSEYSETWTENDIKVYLRYSDNYYKVM